MKGGTAKWLEVNEMEEKFPRRRKSIGYWYNKFVLQLEKREKLLKVEGSSLYKIDANWRERVAYKAEWRAHFYTFVSCGTLYVSYR